MSFIRSPRFHRLKRVLAAWTVGASLLVGQAPGTRVLGSGGWIEYVVGNAPLLITAAHGGELAPASIPNRTFGTFTSDLRTSELARELAELVATETGRRPHLVICHLDRSKIDCNRPIAEGAQGFPATVTAWNDFHAFVATAKQRMNAQHGRGLYLDMHGHGHPETWVEIGYNLSGSQLGLSNTTLNGATYLALATVRTLAGLPGNSLSAILRGPASFGAVLNSFGYAAVPSPANASPAGGNYFSGGYNVETHGSINGGTVDAIQFECPSLVRTTPAARLAFSQAMVAAARTLFSTHYGTSLDAGARVTLTATDAVIAENGGRARFVLRRTGATTSSLTVSLGTQGVAIPGVDVAGIPTTATFPIGASSIDIVPTGIADGLAEGPEPLTLTVDAGAATGVPNSATCVVDDGFAGSTLVGAWRFDEPSGATLVDASSANRPGTLAAAPGTPARVAGRFAGALGFDGVDDTATAPIGDWIPGTSFSIGLRFKTTTIGTGRATLFSQGVDGAPQSINISMSRSDGSLRTALAGSEVAAPDNLLDVAVDLRDGGWHDYVLTVDENGHARVHIDGTLRVENNVGTGPWDPSGALTLGARSDFGAGRWFNGAMDDVAVWTRALCTDEISAYGAGTFGVLPLRPGTDDDLVLSTGVDGPATTGAGRDLKDAPPGSLLTFQIETPAGRFSSSPVALVATLAPDGSFPTWPGLPMLHVDPAASPLLLDLGPLPSSGFALSVAAPGPGLAGLTVIVQAIAVGTAAANGSFAASDAHALTLH